MELQNLPWYGQLGVFLLIGAICFGLFYYLHYSPTNDNIERVVEDREKIVLEIRKAEKARADRQKIEEQLAANQKILEDLKGILPERREIADILSRIQNIVTNARLRIMRFTPGKEVARDIYIEWPIVVSVEGSYHNLGIFFDQLSRLKKIFNVYNLNITPLSSTREGFTIKADFNATTYIYREAPPKKAPARQPARRAQPVRDEEDF